MPVPVVKTDDYDVQVADDKGVFVMDAAGPKSFNLPGGLTIADVGLSYIFAKGNAEDVMIWSSEAVGFFSDGAVINQTAGDASKAWFSIMLCAKADDSLYWLCHGEGTWEAYS